MRYLREKPSKLLNTGNYDLIGIVEPVRAITVHVHGRFLSDILIQLCDMINKYSYHDMYFISVSSLREKKRRGHRYPGNQGE